MRMHESLLREAVRIHPQQSDAILVFHVPDGGKLPVLRLFCLGIDPGQDFLGQGIVELLDIVGIKGIAGNMSEFVSEKIKMSKPKL